MMNQVWSMRSKAKHIMHWTPYKPRCPIIRITHMNSNEWCKLCGWGMLFIFLWWMVSGRKQCWVGSSLDTECLSGIKEGIWIHNRWVIFWNIRVWFISCNFQKLYTSPCRRIWHFLNLFVHTWTWPIAKIGVGISPNTLMSTISNTQWVWGRVLACRIGNF